MTILRSLRRPALTLGLLLTATTLTPALLRAQEGTNTSPDRSGTDRFGFRTAPRSTQITRDALKAVSANTSNASSTQGSALVRGGLAYRGTPYRFGRTGGGAFDCSGFTQHVYRKQGIYLPRTAQEQWHYGRKVEKSEMQPGDLVFFKNTYKRGISHVGIYIGDGEFVHASSGSHKVTVSNLSSGYYVKHWAGARRLTD